MIRSLPLAVLETGRTALIQSAVAAAALPAHSKYFHVKVISRMWKFANPIKHPIPETRWPTAEEAARSLLFQPITIGSVELESRTWVPAMVPWRATEDGFVTKANLDWYGRFAEGQPGAIVVEATGVRDIPSGPLLRIGHDRFIPGLRELVETVRQASLGRTRLF